jgi:ribose transport system substrate-binding protein
VKSGGMGADALGQALGGKGRVLLVRYQEGSASTTMREEGFVAALKERWPGVQLVVADQYAGATPDTAKRAGENLLNRYGRDLQGIMVVNESSTTGLLLALQDAGLAGRIALVGFDGNPQFPDALRKGQLAAFVLQDPFRMAALAVRTLVDHLQGKPVPKRIDTAVAVVTARDLDQPETQALLRPPVERYLKPGE